MQLGRQFDRLVVPATSGAAACQTDFQHDLERHQIVLIARPVLDQRQLHGRIHQEHGTQVGVATQQRLQPGQVLGGHHLIGDQRPACARCNTDFQLRDVGEGQAPRTRIQLAPEQLRRHAGLAMRRQVDVPLARALLHPDKVVLQRRSFEQGDGQWQIARQHIPALACHVAATQRRLRVGKAFEIAAEQRVNQVGTGGHWRCRLGLEVERQRDLLQPTPFNPPSAPWSGAAPGHTGPPGFHRA